MAEDQHAALRDLEKRISSLELKYNVALGIIGTVAVIFGASGAWGGKLLSDANEKITQLAKSVTDVSVVYAGYEQALNKAKETAVTEVNGSARDALEREAANQLGALQRRVDSLMQVSGQIKAPIKLCYGEVPGNFAWGMPVPQNFTITQCNAFSETVGGSTKHLVGCLNTDNTASWGRDAKSPPSPNSCGWEP
jgi:hypothetical protein